MRLTPDMEIPSSMYIMLLPKLTSVDLENAFSTIMVFHATLLLIKELTSQQCACAHEIHWPIHDRLTHKGRMKNLRVGLPSEAK